MSKTWFVFKRELTGYFITPVAYVFIIIFLILAGVLTFSEGFGQFFVRQNADLVPFFQFHPFLYLFLIPAISMRLWSEERRQGTIELLLTLPLTLPQIVFGKFLAAWAFTGIALLLTFPIWITVNYLGEPDNGVILASYFGSLLLAGGFLAIGSCISAITKNQVIAFVVTVMVGLIFVLAGLQDVQNIFVSLNAPQTVIETVATFSFLDNFSAITQGRLELSSLLYFASLMVCFLLANVIIVDLKKGA